MSESQRTLAGIDVVAASDMGLVRRRNEDYVYVNGRGVRDSRMKSHIPGSTLAHGFLVSVADGVGGNPAGDRASASVSRTIGEMVAEIAADQRNGAQVQRIREAAIEANKRLLAEARSDLSMSGMSTTYTGLFMLEGRWLLIHAGDSRMYELRDRHLVQTSRDHSLREMLGNPRIPGNILANCYGREEDFFVDVTELTPCAARLYLICSDGLTDYTSLRWVEQTLARSAERAELSALERAGADLIEAAKRSGGGDNISLVILRPVHA